jgi:hypothetical protein
VLEIVRGINEAAADLKEILPTNMKFQNTKDVSVSIGTRLWAGRSRARFLAEANGFPLLQNVQIGSKAQSTSYITNEGFVP